MAAAKAEVKEEAKEGRFANKGEAVAWAVENLGIKESTAKGYSLAKLEERAEKFYAEQDA